MPEEIVDRRGWYLDKGINPAYVVPLIGAILAGLIWAGEVNSGQKEQNTKLEVHEKKIDVIERNGREDAQRTQDKLDAILREVRSRK